MISFACPGCRRSFSVPDTYAGRRATCKACGGPIVVPSEQPEAKSVPPGAADALPKIPLRIRRLQSDAKQMAEAFAGFPFIKILNATGNPPDVYEVEYAINGLERGKDDQPVPRDLHRVEIRLTADYPRVAPVCRMLTPIFHPNIDPATICVGDHWAAGERLAALVIRIGEMIAYQAYNIQSPLDAEAAMWSDLNAEKLPIDSRSLHSADL
ncbi:MAG TPA: ubiquitin-conjugating enzyme E2 [Tepidisphaeraceae bacterium]|jgi:ubiquitin-protein ligase